MPDGHRAFCERDGASAATQRQSDHRRAFANARSRVRHGRRIDLPFRDAEIALHLRETRDVVTFDQRAAALSTNVDCLAPIADGRPISGIGGTHATAAGCLVVIAFKSYAWIQVA